MLAPDITPLVLRTNCWDEAGGWVIETTGLWAFAETTVEMEGLATPQLVTVEAVEITDELEAGFGKSWGWALLFCATFFAPDFRKKVVLMDIYL